MSFIDAFIDLIDWVLYGVKNAKIDFEKAEVVIVERLKATYDKQEAFYQGKLKEVYAKREKLMKIALKYF